MTMSDADTNQAREPMTATEPATTAVGNATELKSVAVESQPPTTGPAITQKSAVVLPDADSNDRLVSLVVKQQETKQAVTCTGNASSEEESPKLVASLKPSQDICALPAGLSNPVSPSSADDDASKQTVDGPDTSAATSSTQPMTVPTSSQNDSLRRGKWTPEEEEYVSRVISDFNAGFLKAPPGTTLRSYLSEKLNCDPMRITKKFTGELAIGKRVFHPVARTLHNSAYIDKAQVCWYFFQLRNLSLHFRTIYLTKLHISFSLFFSNPDGARRAGKKLEEATGDTGAGIGKKSCGLSSWSPR